MTTAMPLSDIAAEPSPLLFLGVAVAAAAMQGSLLRRGLRLQQRVHEWRAAAASGQWHVLDPSLVPDSRAELVALALLAALPLALLAVALRARALFPQALVTVDVIERARWVARTVAAPLHAVRVGLVVTAAVWLAAAVVLSLAASARLQLKGLARAAARAAEAPSEARLAAAAVPPRARLLAALALVTLGVGLGPTTLGALAYCDAVLVASEGTPHVPWAVRAHGAEAALDAARSRFDETAQHAPWAAGLAMLGCGGLAWGDAASRRARTSLEKARRRSV
jgi:hypothetical protein